MYSKDYELLVNRLVLENNKIRDQQLVWGAQGDITMIEIGRQALKHNEETISFIKKVDKEIEEDESR